MSVERKEGRRKRTCRKGEGREGGKEWRTRGEDKEEGWGGQGKGGDRGETGEHMICKPMSALDPGHGGREQQTAKAPCLQSDHMIHFHKRT